ncbi:Fe-S cluster assembly protein SufB [Enterococcus sp. PF1-24]|uniref:Fe-S cluster assembly protein SufB n=1 Tax=unclassified Enterococcus TaxID=2608891 RepID=UPI00247653DB|nr:MULTISPECIES: Fe-S cluster assembly protein SufB [unclassified Enterococcus]MDH6364721.1 Fe-S cluster assembly protein SufB [Enterococcus sp. PFB1-1]MDH6401803.1 Fe-S cluster assembly protein SufB [Enterococcus sp. PF1-24]
MTVKARDYQYGFHDEVEPLFTSGQGGLTRELVQEISEMKQEPQWMLDYRLKAFELFEKLPLPKWGPDLSEIRFEDVIYYQKLNNEPSRDWEDVPDKIKDTFERLGIPEAERKFLAGAAAQYESEVVYHNMKEEFENLGIVFLDTDSALKEYPGLVKEYFGSLVKASEHKFAALNAAIWSGGTFIYVPKGVQCDIPIQTYFRINGENAGQFERSLIIVDEGASVHYIEGCTAPSYTTNSLHAATVEIIVKKDAFCRYTTMQNWSDNVYNLVTERGSVEENGMLEWIDGNLGSKVNMKYPCTHLNGRNAKTSVLSMAFANYGQHLDAGCKVYHNASQTSSTIVSKSVAKDGGRTDYRGSIYFGRDSSGSKSHIECDTILMDNESKADTIPYNKILNGNVTLEHEASVSKVSEDQLFYLMSRGLSEEEATAMIINGFMNPITKELPMEYAVELNQLITMSMEGSVG